MNKILTTNGEFTKEEIIESLRRLDNREPDKGYILLGNLANTLVVMGELKKRTNQ